MMSKREKFEEKKSEEICMFVILSLPMVPEMESLKRQRSLI